MKGVKKKVARKCCGSRVLVHCSYKVYVLVHVGEISETLLKTFVSSLELLSLHLLMMFDLDHTRVNIVSERLNRQIDEF